MNEGGKDREIERERKKLFAIHIPLLGQVISNLFSFVLILNIRFSVRANEVKRKFQMKHAQHVQRKTVSRSSLRVSSFFNFE